MTYHVKRFDFESMSPQARLAALQTHAIALTVDEALTIQKLLGRPPTLPECILWGIQGSEHCSYKSTRQHLQQLCTDGPNVVLGAKEDAGVVWVAEDDEKKRYCIVISHESHNHPSQVVPFEGAATGIGGNVRDVSCMGATVIANADSLRFGDRDFHRANWIAEDVVKGIASYSNAIGVPNVAGDVFYHPAFNDNCLVTVVSLGVVREDQIIHSYAPPNAEGYHLILVGKPTDNSGFGGASFASVDLDEKDSEANRGAVQEPNAFLGRILLQSNQALFKKLQAQGLTDRVGFKDLGAGGIACASIEIAESGGYGAEMVLDQVPLSQQGLDPTVILCAETQERYMWVVPPELTDMVLAHYNEQWQLPQISVGANATVVGKIRDDDQYVVHYHEQCLVSASAAAITKGISYDRPTAEPKRRFDEPHAAATALTEQWLQVNQHQGLAAPHWITEQYDKQVQGRTIIERGEADAGVLQPFNSSDYPAEIQKTGVALAVSANPFYGQIDPYWTAVHAVVNSVCKVVAVGATPWAMTDCLCFGNPEQPEQMWEVAQAVRGLKDAAATIGLLDYEGASIPIVAGNVSLYNQSKNGKAIPASPMVSCLGRMNNVDKVLNPELQKQESILICLGARGTELGGSVYYDTLGKLGNDLPQPKLTQLRRHAQQLLQLNQNGLLLSAKAIEYGGLSAAVEFMVGQSAYGAILTTPRTDLTEEAFWFGEMPGWVLEIDKAHYKQVINSLKLADAVWYEIGITCHRTTQGVVINDHIC